MLFLPSRLFSPLPSPLSPPSLLPSPLCILVPDCSWSLPPVVHLVWLCSLYPSVPLPSLPALSACVTALLRACVRACAGHALRSCVRACALLPLRRAVKQQLLKGVLLLQPLVVLSVLICQHKTPLVCTLSPPLLSSPLISSDHPAPLSSLSHHAHHLSLQGMLCGWWWWGRCGGARTRWWRGGPRGSRGSRRTTRPSSS